MAENYVSLEIYIKGHAEQNKIYYHDFIEKIRIMPNSSSANTLYTLHIAHCKNYVI